MLTLLDVKSFLSFFFPFVAADKKRKIQFSKIQKYYSSEEGLT